MPSEHAARVRAAVAYSGKTRSEFAAAINTSPPTLDRMTSKTRPRSLKVEEMQRIARAAGVPPEWFTADFGRLPEIGTFPPALADSPAEELAQALEEPGRVRDEQHDEHERKRAANQANGQAGAPSGRARRKAQ